MWRQLGETKQPSKQTLQTADTTTSFMRVKVRSSNWRLLIPTCSATKQTTPVYSQLVCVVVYSLEEIVSLQLDPTSCDRPPHQLLLWPGFFLSLMEVNECWIRREVARYWMSCCVSRLQGVGASILYITAPFTYIFFRHVSLPAWSLRSFWACKIGKAIIVI